jgi:oligosaccharide repeat unit polymerase
MHSSRRVGFLASWQHVLLRPDVYTLILWALSFLLPFILSLSGDTTFLYYLRDSGAALFADAPTLLRRSLLISVVLPVSAFIATFLFRARRRATQRPFKVNLRALRGAILVVIIVSFGAQLTTLFLIGTNNLINGLAERVTLFAGLNWLVEMGAMSAYVTPTVIYLFYLERLQAQLRRLRRQDYVWITVLSFVGLTGAAFTGSKTTFAAPLMCGAFLMAASRALKLYRAVIFAVIFVCLYFIWDKLLREYIVLGEFAGSGLDSSEFVLNAYSNTLPALETLAICSGVFGPDAPLLYGETYLSTLTVWVPRQLWPNKLDSPAQLFSLMVFPNRSYGDTVPPGLLGEAWINFGLRGVVIVSLLTASVLRGVYLAYRRHGTPWTLIRLTLFLAALFSYLRGESLGSTVSLVATMVPNWLLVRQAVSVEAITSEQFGTDTEQAQHLSVPNRSLSTPDE